MMKPKMHKLLVLAALAAVPAAIAAAPANPAPVAPSSMAQDLADGAFKGGPMFGEVDGEKMYAHVCAGCHMPDARGAKGVGFYPALAGDPKLAEKTWPLMVLLQGLDGMPPLGRQMSDQQVADVVNYVRSHFGNRYKDALTPAEVKAMRGS